MSNHPPPVKSAQTVVVSCTAILTIFLAACVDNGENARQFCERHDALIAEPRDGEDLTTDAASDIENELEKSMRDAEDATRDVRSAARDLVDAYGDIAGELDADDTDAVGLKEAREELQAARVELRAGCADALDGS